MRDAVSLALRLSKDRTREDLQAEPMFSLALVRCLEVLGEAASKVSEEVRSRLPGIPFSRMVSTRNRLIHAYFDVDLDVVWKTVTEDLPPLVDGLESAIAELDESEPPPVSR